jgi:hypothetical protein
MNSKEEKKRNEKTEAAKEKRRSALELLEQLVELSIEDFLKNN